MNDSRQNLNYCLLLTFVVFRPIMSTEIFQSGSIFREIFGIIFSFMFLFGFLISGINKNHITVLCTMCIFIGYSFISIFWGSNIREISRLILPFFVFFSMISLPPNKEKLRSIFKTLVGAFIIPIAISTYTIITGTGFDYQIYWSGIERYSGIYNGSHTLAHEMFVFFVISSTYLYFDKNDGQKNTKLNIFKWLVFLTIGLSLFNIYKSHTRTVYIGFVIFSCVWLVYYKQYKILFFGGTAFIFLAIFSQNVHKIFFDFIEPFQGKKEISVIGSGRLGLWIDKLSFFFGHPFENLFLGLGLGNESYDKVHFGASHNDILSILIGLGAIGLFLYILVLVIFITRIIFSNIEKDLKAIYTGFIFSVIFMNFASNSYISRFEMGQYFFLILGSLYCYIKSEMEIGNDKNIFPYFHTMGSHLSEKAPF